MRSRALLHVDKLEAFKEWLTKHGHKWRPGRGEFQVIQIQDPKNGSWTPIFSRMDTTAGHKLVHYTAYGYPLKLVYKFIRHEIGQQLDGVGRPKLPCGICNPVILSESDRRIIDELTNKLKAHDSTKHVAIRSNN